MRGEARGIVRKPCNESANIGFVVEKDECIATVPSSNYCIAAGVSGYRTPSPQQVVITGEIRSYRLEVSSLSYGLTTIGSNLLSLFGAPNSTARLVLEMDLRVQRGSDAKPILEKSVALKTRHRAVALYYGGDYAFESTRELEDRLAGELALFAGELRPLLREPGKVTAAVP